MVNMVKMYIPMPVLPYFGSTPQPHLHCPFLFTVYVGDGASLPKRCSAKAIATSVSVSDLFPNTFLRFSP
jgi:hypothetical protein